METSTKRPTAHPNIDVYLQNLQELRFVETEQHQTKDYSASHTTSSADHIRSHL
jgi:hypothetical protein